MSKFSQQLGKGKRMQERTERLMTFVSQTEPKRQITGNKKGEI